MKAIANPPDMRIAADDGAGRNPGLFGELVGAAAAAGGVVVVSVGLLVVVPPFTGGIDGTRATGTNFTGEILAADGATGAAVGGGCIPSGLPVGQRISILAHKNVPPMQVQVVVLTQFPEGQHTSS
jgi:hypothetical protein